MTRCPASLLTCGLCYNRWVKNYVLHGTSGRVTSTHDGVHCRLEDVFSEKGLRTLAILDARSVMNGPQGQRIQEQSEKDPDLYVIWGTEHDYVDPMAAPDTSPLTDYDPER